MHLDAKGWKLRRYTVYCLLCSVLFMGHIMNQWLTNGLSPWRPKFNARLLHMGFVMDKVSMT